MAIDVAVLAAKLAASSGIAAKADIGFAAENLGLIGALNPSPPPPHKGEGLTRPHPRSARNETAQRVLSPLVGEMAGRPEGDFGAARIPVGDDCAALPDGDGYLLFAIEGFINEFVAADPWFAGWCGVMVNISDVVAMGGRPVAVVDAVWAKGEENASPVLEGMRAAAATYGVPIVGGHTNIRTDRHQLSVAILGRAKKLLTSFDAKPGDVLIAAIDHRGRYREPFNNWEAATDAPPARLCGDLEIMAQIAEAGLALAAKDISQGGIPGTAIMLAECSGVGIDIDLTAIPLPEGVVLERWLSTFPSYGYLLSVAPSNAEIVLKTFTARGIVAAAIGTVTAGSEVAISADGNRAVIRDHAMAPLLRLGPAGEKREREDAA